MASLLNSLTVHRREGIEHELPVSEVNLTPHRLALCASAVRSGEHATSTFFRAVCATVHVSAVPTHNTKWYVNHGTLLPPEPEARLRNIRDFSLLLRRTFSQSTRNNQVLSEEEKNRFSFGAFGHGLVYARNQFAKFFIVELTTRRRCDHLPRHLRRRNSRL